MSGRGIARLRTPIGHWKAIYGYLHIVDFFAHTKFLKILKKCQNLIPDPHDQIYSRFELNDKEGWIRIK